jgi:four helix bundle protein
MTPEEMKARTKAFALAIIKLASELPDTPVAKMIRGQLLRCGTSVGANYRASCRAKSKPDFISKLGIVIEEADETIYWLEIIIDSGILPSKRVTPLIKEADEIVAITVASVNTARKSS